MTHGTANRIFTKAPIQAKRFSGYRFGCPPCGPCVYGISQMEVTHVTGFRVMARITRYLLNRYRNRRVNG